MQLTVTATGEHAAEDVRSLREWLVAEEDLRGRVRLVATPPEAGKLGALSDALMVALEPGGAAAVVASVLIAYIRRGHGKTRLKVTQPDGTAVELAAERVRGLDAAAVQALTTELARSFQRTGPAPPDDSNQTPTS